MTTQTLRNIPTDTRYAQRARRLVGSIIDSSTSMLAKYDRDIVPFAVGSPGPEAIPASLLADLARDGLAVASTYDYAPSEGDAGLREEIGKLLADHGRVVDPDRILVTSGGMQGLDLACKLFVDGGALVVAEKPTYTNGIATIASYEGAVLEVSVDNNGMNIDELVSKVETRQESPAVIYTIPSFQNPSGTTLSLARRKRLMELARRWDAVVIEDDPYGLVRFSGKPLPTLVELADRPDRVIRVETFSKILAPGLRVGWIEADPTTVALMINAKQAMDTCTNLPAQRLVASFLRQGHMTPHLERLRTEYRQRRDEMYRALEAAFPGGDVQWTHPSGGMFLWLTLPDSIDAEALFPIALECGVAFIPGTAFSVEGEFRNALRLSYATNNAARIREGVYRLRSAIDHAYHGLLVA